MLPSGANASFKKLVLAVDGPQHLSTKLPTKNVTFGLLEESEQQAPDLDAFDSEEQQEAVDPEETVDDALADIDSVRPDKKLKDVVSEENMPDWLSSLVPKSEQSEDSESKEAPKTVHTLPKMVPTQGYKKHLTKIYKKADKENVEDKKALQRENKNLKKKVVALEGSLSSKDKAFIREEKQVAAAVEQDTRERAAGETTGFLVVGTILLGGQLFTLAMSERETVRAKTWSLIERTMIVFVAIVWFQAFDDFFSWIGFNLHAEIFCSVLHVLVVFSLLVWAAVKSMVMDETGNMLSIITSWGMHYLSFALVHTAEHTQLAYFSSHWGLALLSLPVMLACHLAFCYITRAVLIRWVAHPDDADDDNFVDKIEELEDDAAGMMLAFLCAMLVRYCIAGHYASYEAGERRPHDRHNWIERLIMLSYALVMAAASFIFLPKLNQLGESLHTSSTSPNYGTYFLQRMVLLLNPFLTMSAAWGLLLWADWEFYEHLFREHKILARLIVALGFSFISLTTIWIFGIREKREQHVDRNHPDQLRRASSRALDLAWRWSDLERRKFILNAVAVVIAFPWEETLDVSIDVATQGQAHPYPLKVFLAFVVTATFVPLYLQFIRKASSDAEKVEDRALAF
eukprot:gnl/TRDRNA2_/TRDRNA2_85761_c1_seq6.p1 gnl/TRDRNA2_/TRDRNA2_85761_c1~~gnl/TRDRNA2_/TRDRNA2_85761_c1_seq6.p1  ORF type:complete len:662 (+),score=124.12 gnl/TRDRNA2_/TRDRNA2_85761_c1_seq6:105-1988(+)